MKRSRIVLLIMLLGAIPTTLFLGVKLFGRSYYILITLAALEILIPFLMTFEGRKPKPRELVTVAVMAAIATISRVAVPIPSFKPIFAFIMLTGIAFGPETGFIVGALGALGSDFFYGQEPYSPWQTMAYGLAEVLAGICFAEKCLPRKNWVMGIFCFVCTVLFIGPVLDTSTVTIMATKFTWESILPFYLSGIPVNTSQGIAGFITMMLFGNTILEKLNRVKSQYSILEMDEYLT